jgi:hypothetical protein
MSDELENHPIATAVWRRLDVPGHDACQVLRGSGGHRLEGVAVWSERSVPHALHYEVVCDADWTTRHGRVHGWRGSEAVSLAFERSSSGTWSQDGKVVPGLEGCFDLDFGFTPATNFTQLRRTRLPIGAAADVPVAWFDLAATTLKRLNQRYERRAERAYWYAAPSFGYAQLLEVDRAGFVTDYPGLWVSER